MNRLFFILLLLCLLPLSAQAQTETPTPTETQPTIPQVHVVAEGENPTYIADLYGVAVEDLLLLNNLTDSAVLQIGQSLKIPGGQGEAVVTAYQVQAGDTLAGIAAVFNTTLDALTQTNRLINPHYDLAVGQTLSVISRTGSSDPQPVTGMPYVVSANETLWEIAAKHQMRPDAIAAENNLSAPFHLFPGQRLRLPAAQPYRFLPGEWQEIEIRPFPILQGSTLSIYVENLLTGTPTGQLAGQTLVFTPHENGYVALVGLDAFTPVGLHWLELSGSGERPWRPFRQNILVASGGYGTQFITVGEELSRLLDPTIRAEEDTFLASIYAQSEETPQWEGLFQVPVSTTVITAGYGDGRSYNGGPIQIFHTGVDFAGSIGTPILAPANGKVVYNNFLELRGNVLILDHGLGVMTAYFHLSETFVAEGDTVTTGQMIAAGGSTGLSTGAHLHWDVRVHTIAVNPLQWTTTPFP